MTRFRPVLSLCLCIAVGPAFGSSADPLFQANDRLEIVIEAPWATFLREKSRDKNLDGILRVTDATGAEQAFDVKVRARGRSRHEYCDFPPIRLKFRRSKVKDTLFDQQHKLKLVSHCMMSGSYEQLVLREYLAYRMLNTITDNSFRVRLMRVRYVDSEGRRDDITRYAFLIEHKKRLGKRLDTAERSVRKTSVDALDPAHLNVTSVFAFMVGNTDYSPIVGPDGKDCCHNIKLFGNRGELLLAIPYDFDQAGVVDAPYAVPNQRLGIRSVQQRVYRGRCGNNQHLEETLQLFQDRREEIYALIEQQEELKDSARKRVGNYIERFFEIIDDPRKVERQLEKRCV